MNMEELMNDAEFLAGYANVSTPEELVDVFAARGIEIAPELAAEAFAPVSADGELDMEDLEGVSGGCKIGSKIFKITYTVCRMQGYSPVEARVIATCTATAATGHLHTR